MAGFVDFAATLSIAALSIHTLCLLRQTILSL